MSESVESRVRGRGSIAGQVLTSEGEPIAEAAVMITGHSPPHPDIALLTDVQGRYRFDGLLPGEYEILVNTEAFGMQTRPVSLGAGQVARLDFSLRG